MSTFAVTNSSEVIDSVNYLLSNLNTGNVTGNVSIPTGTLVANASTGEITQYNTVGDIYGYINQYVNLRYANNAAGTSGFSTVPTNSLYFGVYNSATPTPSANPAAYVWREVAGGFGTTKTIYYSAIGGRQVLWAAASSPPSSNYVISVANVAIDLDVVTTAAGLPGERGPIAMAYVITTADPNTATSAQLTSWFEASRSAVVPPIGTGLTPPVAGDTAFFTYPTTAAGGTFTYNGSVWNSAVSQVVSGNTLVADSVTGSKLANATITGDKVSANTITGNNIVVNTITGNLIAANTITGNNISSNTITGNLIVASTITGNLIAANTITGNNISSNTITGNLIVASTITGNLIAANTITGNLIQASTITGNLIAANTITGNLIQANTITGNLIAANTVSANSLEANSITATQISSAYIYAGNIVSNTATLGDVTSTGYWLRYTDGAARFGGNVSIGNNASIGGNLNVTGLINTGNLNSNTVITTTITPGSVTTAASFNTLTPLVRTTPSIAVWYYDTAANVTVTTAQLNQPVYLFGTFENQVTTTQIFSPPRTWSLTYDIGMFRKVGATYTQIGDFQRYVLTNQASTVGNSPVEITPFVGYLDIPVSIGTYEYVYGMRYVAAANVGIPSFDFETRNILAQLLKR